MALILPPVLPPPLLQLEKKWWELELEMHTANRGANDPEDAPGKHLLPHRSIYEDVPTTTEWQTAWWSAIDINNVIDHDMLALASAPTVKQEDDSSNDFESGSDDYTTTPSTAPLDLDFFHLVVHILQT
jgi:hypothetical protein